LAEPVDMFTEVSRTFTKSNTGMPHKLFFYSLRSE
jgi:hypothetical protein